MEWSSEVVTRAHPDSAHAWFLTDEAIDRFVLEAPGKPVTWNYNSGQRVGNVVAAGRGENGSVVVTCELDDAAEVMVPDGRPLGEVAVKLAPLMENPNAQPNPPAGPLPMGVDWHVVEFALVPAAGPAEGEADARGDDS